MGVCHHREGRAEPSRVVWALGNPWECRKDRVDRPQREALPDPLGQGLASLPCLLVLLQLVDAARDTGYLDAVIEKAPPSDQWLALHPDLHQSLHAVGAVLLSDAEAAEECDGLFEEVYEDDAHPKGAYCVTHLTGLRQRPVPLDALRDAPGRELL